MTASSKKQHTQHRQTSAKSPTKTSAIVEPQTNHDSLALRDAVERSRVAEHEARIAEVLRSDLLAVATHDLRNPLGVILVTNTMLARELTTKNQIEHLTAIRRAAVEMSQIIEDLTDGAKIDAGQLEVAEDECEPAALVKEAIAMAQSLIGDKPIEVESHVEPGLPVLMVDRHRVLVVFTRALANALRFMPKDGVISIHARRVEAGVRFSVKDSGPAIPESQRPYAFLRRPPIGRRACRGTGLGMFVLKGIVEAHGGHVELVSELERGNTLSFTLPTGLVTGRT